MRVKGTRAHEVITNIREVLQGQESGTSPAPRIKQLFSQTNLLIDQIGDYDENSVDVVDIAKLVLGFFNNLPSEDHDYIRKNCLDQVLVQLLWQEDITDDLLFSDDEAVELATSLLHGMIIEIKKDTPDNAVAILFELFNALNKPVFLATQNVVIAREMVAANILQYIQSFIIAGNTRALLNILHRNAAAVDFLTEHELSSMLPNEFGEMLPLRTHMEIFKVSDPNPKAAVLMGSTSDWTLMEPAAQTFKELGIPIKVAILSAHRNADRVPIFAQWAQDNDIDVIVAGAGGAAALPGSIAATFSCIPVIGVPLKNPTMPLDGMEALTAISQMPPGVPALTVGINAAKNAAIAATTILSIKDPEIKNRLKRYNNKVQADAIAQSNDFTRVGWDNWSGEVKRRDDAKRTKLMTTAFDNTPMQAFPATSSAVSTMQNGNGNGNDKSTLTADGSSFVPTFR
ncbi:MAG TPA: 5-(carboxyamino)imidazole ribonucleotide mutase [Gammaproteobacteria bacterium]|nr:5-(carboxyamino)imidazole ribonucleotide mutase [Gammaproteobacteria bacterium]